MMDDPLTPPGPSGSNPELPPKMHEALTAHIRAMCDCVDRARLRPVYGEIASVKEGIIRARLPEPKIGDACFLEVSGAEMADKGRIAEIVGIEDGLALLVPLSDIEGLNVARRVWSTQSPLTLVVGDGLLGKVINARGTPMDGSAVTGATQTVSLRSPPLNAMHRKLASEPFDTGLRAIDGLLTMAKGQRMGVVGPAGCGKSTLLATILGHAKFDRAVIAMIGERGREVREFVETLLSPADRARCLFVASTSDENAGTRALAAQSAVRIAEFFADQDQEVLLIFDNLTRYARARRDMGLAIGELPSRRGFTPQSLNSMAGLIERVGTRQTGVITAFFGVLTEGDEDDDPVREEALSLLDGHIELTPKLARAGHFPAIDVLRSKSRLIDVAAGPEAVDAANAARSLLSRREEIDLMIQIGEYQPGQNAETDALIETCNALNAFLKQARDDVTSREDSLKMVSEMVG